MAQIGQKGQKKLVQDKEEFIDPGFFKIQFSIGGKVFKKAVDGLLAFDTDNLDDLTDEDLDKALDQCSYYRFTFLAAGVELETAMDGIKREFETWYGEAAEGARRSIIEDRKEWKEKEKLPNSWMGSITKDDLKHWVMNSESYKEEYNNYMIKLAEMKKQLLLCYGLRDILQERGRHLQSLGKRRLENRRMNFGVKDYGSG